MKTYLKDLTPEEVIRRLKAGEVVKNETTSYVCKVIDGVLCGFRSDGEININTTFTIAKGGKYYFETPDELKLEVGKCYRTRDGRKAFVAVVDDKYVFGVIEDDRVTATWNKKVYLLVKMMVVILSQSGEMTMWQKIKCWLKYRKCWWYKYLPPKQKLFGGKVKR